MKIALADASSPHLDLDFSPTGDQPRTLSFSQVQSLGGKLEIGASAVVIDAAELIALTLARATWTLTKGSVKVEGPTNAEAVAADIAIAKSAARERGEPPVKGTARFGRLAGEQIALELGGRHTRFGVTLEEVAIEARGDGVQEVAVGRLELRELQTSVGAMIVRVSAIELTGLTATIDGKKVRAAATGGGARGITLSGGDTELAVDEVILPAGISFADRKLSLPSLRAGSIQVSTEVPGKPKPEGEPREKKPLPIDLRLLDELNGKIDVDLGVDVSLPVIGGRKATHHFRIDVQHGTVDFKELEGDLARLEDAFIDFELDGDRLVLERDIPLIPGDAKPILIWQLDEQAEVELARRNRVRLRRLPAFEPAEPKKKKKDDGNSSSVQLRELILGNIDVALSMSAAAAAASLEGAAHDLDGWVQRAGLGEIRISGSVAHVPGAEPQPSSLSIAGRELDLGLAGVPIGSATLASLALSIRVIENVAVEFRGIRPHAVRAALREVALGDVVVELG